MNKKELLTALIAHYTNAIAVLQQASTLDHFVTLINDYYVDLGICNCAKRVFQVDVYIANWIAKYQAVSGLSYWCSTIRNHQMTYASGELNSFIQRCVDECLTPRIDILRQELELTTDNE
jgi:hypothetical protein